MSSNIDMLVALRCVSCGAPLGESMMCEYCGTPHRMEVKLSGFSQGQNNGVPTPIFSISHSPIIGTASTLHLPVIGVLSYKTSG